MGDLAATVLAWGQQVLQQQQQGGEQPTVCFAAIPLLLPAALVVFRAASRRTRGRPAGA